MRLTNLLILALTLASVGLAPLPIHAAPSPPRQNAGVQPTSYPVPASAYFVAPDGKDSNTGTSADSPWTLAKALKQTPRGATIVLRGGVYRTGDIRFNKNYTLQPYLDEKPVLNGSAIATSWARDGDDWKTTWTPRFPPGSSDEARGSHNFDMVWVNQAMLTPVKSRDLVGPGTFFFDYPTNQVYIGADPGSKTVEITAHAVAMERIWWNLGDAPGGADEKGVTVRGLTFTQYAVDGFWTRCSETILENNTFINNAHRGLVTYNNDHVMRNNEISNNGKIGANFGGSRITFENNIVRGNNSRNYLDKESIKFATGEGGLIRNNLFEDNNGNAIWLDVGANGYTIVNNIARNNTGVGIHFEISDRALIAGNLLVGNEIGVLVSTSANARIYNNTFVDNGEALHIREYYRDDEDARKGPGNAASMVVKNNIFANGTSTEWPWALVTVRTGLCGDWKLVTAMDHNAYYRTDTKQPPSVLRWDNQPGAGAPKTACDGQDQAIFATLADFKAKEPGYEQGGLERSGVPEPFFVDAAKGDYQLKAGSPAIGAGEALPADVAVALGWATSKPVDLGALQAGSPGQPPGVTPTPQPQPGGSINVFVPLVRK